MGNEQNKLLEARDGKRLDTRTASAAGDANSAMATLGEVDLPEDNLREKLVSVGMRIGVALERPS